MPAPQAVFAPEAELLLAVASAAPLPQRLSRLAAPLGSPMNTELALELIAKHRLGPLLDWHLDRLAGADSSVTDALREALRAPRRHSTLHSLRLTQELLQIVELFRASNIPVLCYKGPVLADALFEDMALRPCWDLDLLLPADRVLEAKEILLARGYEPEEPMDEAAERRHLAVDCEYNFDHPESGIHVELHWEILDAAHSRRVDTGLLWERPVEHELAGVSLETFAPETLLLVLCVHGGEKHRWKRLKWLCDVARLLVQRELDWDRVLQLAARCQQTDTVLLGVYLAHCLLDAPLPGAVRGKLEGHHALRAQAALILGQLFGPEDAGLPGYRAWCELLECLDGIERARANAAADPEASAALSLSTPHTRLRYLQAIWTPGWREQRRWRLPGSLQFLHYLLRPWPLLKKHGLTGLLRRLR